MKYDRFWSENARVKMQIYLTALNIFETDSAAARYSDGSGSDWRFAPNTRATRIDSIAFDALTKTAKKKKKKNRLP